MNGRCPTCCDSSICDTCFEIVCDTVEANRRRFQKLRAANVSRAMANRIMVERASNAPS